MKSRLVDYAPGDGIFRGDLVYGCCNGNTPSKHGDFPMSQGNKPIVPLKLVEPRDPEVWKRDPELDNKNKEKEDFNYVTICLVSKYKESYSHLRSNIHLTVGKVRLG